MAGQATLPAELEVRRLRRRALQVAGALAFIVLVAVLAPGLGDVRRYLEGADAGWLALGILFEALSSLSYVLMFRPVFCPQMSRRSTADLALSELAVGALVPAAGASGLALGAWALSRIGMPAETIARRSIAFFLIKSSVNFAAVAVLGVLLAASVIGPAIAPSLTLVPGLMAIAAIAAVAAVPLLLDRFSLGSDRADAARWRRALSAVARAVGGGVREAGRILRRGDPRVIAGALGYWAFDNAVLWACFHAIGNPQPLAVVLLGYLIGQMGGLLPLPGGLGGVDGGLIGVLAVYGTPLATAAAAVLLYRVILFWVPLVLGGVAFVDLRRGLNRRPDLCATDAEPAVAGAPG